MAHVDEVAEAALTGSAFAPLSHSPVTAITFWSSATTRMRAVVVVPDAVSRHVRSPRTSF